MKFNPNKKANILLIGSGGVGTMAAYALEKGGKAQVTAVLRSNYAIVKEKGFDIYSIQHGEVRGWRPTTSTYLLQSLALVSVHSRLLT